MHPKTVKKILENEEELDIGQMAEAILQDKEREPKKKHIPSVSRQLHAWQHIQGIEKEKIAWRNRLAKVWPKKKES